MISCLLPYVFLPFLAWAWLSKPKADVVIPKKKQPLPKIFTEKRVKVRSTACTTLHKRPVVITMYLGLDIIIKLKFTTNFDRCAILNVLNYLTNDFGELIHN